MLLALLVMEVASVAGSRPPRLPRSLAPAETIGEVTMAPVEAMQQLSVETGMPVGEETTPVEPSHGILALVAAAGRCCSLPQQRLLA
jgi:hypothetical protein